MSREARPAGRRCRLQNGSCAHEMRAGAIHSQNGSTDPNTSSGLYSHCTCSTQKKHSSTFEYWSLWRNELQTQGLALYMIVQSFSMACQLCQFHSERLASSKGRVILPASYSAEAVGHHNRQEEYLVYGASQVELPKLVCSPPASTVNPSRPPVRGAFLLYLVESTVSPFSTWKNQQC